METSLRSKVVVITGASSGIGKAAALAFAAEGARLVLTARREVALMELADSCRSLGSEAVIVPADIADETTAGRIVQTAIGRFGQIDVWVNNAAVASFARLEDTPPRVMKRVIDVNLLGSLYSMQAVLPVFRGQGHGVLINVSSVNSKLGSPYAAPYVATKFALCGAAESVRMELRDSGVKVCSVIAGSADTPFYQHAANYSGWRDRPVGPVNAAWTIAQVIVRAAKHPRREVHAGRGSMLSHMLRVIAPPLAMRMMNRQVNPDRYLDAHAVPSDGSLFRPVESYSTISGGWLALRPPARVRRRLAAMVAWVAELLAVTAGH